jgi:hypothetical protein
LQSWSSLRRAGCIHLRGIFANLCACSLWTLGSGCLESGCIIGYLTHPNITALLWMERIIILSVVFEHFTNYNLLLPQTDIKLLSCMLRYPCGLTSSGTYQSPHCQITQEKKANVACVCQKRKINYKFVPADADWTDDSYLKVSNQGTETFHHLDATGLVESILSE